MPVEYPYATSDKGILWEYGTKVLKFPQKSEGLLIKKVKIAFMPPFLRQNATLTLSFPYLFGLFVL